LDAQQSENFKSIDELFFILIKLFDVSKDTLKNSKLNKDEIKEKVARSFYNPLREKIK
jgi:hypothetical protein